METLSNAKKQVNNIEVENFYKNFKQFQHQKIVLYGIGRYTATLLKGIQGFHIIGLMDKNVDNIGKIILGLPVMKLEEVEEKADLIVINTSEMYWELIYNRISHSKIPIYYLNGKVAEKKIRRSIENRYFYMHIEDLINKIMDVDIVSFDFFDTLFMRMVCNPRDIFELLEVEQKSNEEFFTVEQRNKALGELNKNYTLDELYCKIKDVTGMSSSVMAKIKKREIELEKKLLYPRKEILKLFEGLIGKKEVWIISDMYLPKSFYLDVLKGYGIEFNEKNIFISSELGKSKEDGTLWTYVQEKTREQTKILHIGDNLKADIEIPSKHGINTYYLPSSWELFQNSSLEGLASLSCSLYSSCVVGLQLQYFFNTPYTKYNQKNKFKIEELEDLGYLLIGPVLLTFFLWLREECQKDNKTELLFFARDGYFLEENYNYLCGLLGETPNGKYLPISRQLAMIANLKSEDDVIEFVLKSSYTGTFSEMLEQYFDISNVGDVPTEKYEICIRKYTNDILKKINNMRDEYLSFLKSFQIDEQKAVVDLGYYGTNQKYFNELIEQNLLGYYFMAYLGEDGNKKTQMMKSCYQLEDDKEAKECNLYKNVLFIESFLTAPYGMIKAVRRNGTLVCGDKKKNQEFFDERKKINHGIKKFLKDYVKYFGNLSLELDRKFVDQYYGYLLDSNMEFSEQIKQIFWYDNEMMKKGENMIFE